MADRTSSAPAPLAVARLRRHALAMLGDSVGQADALGVAAGVAGELAQAGDAGVEAGQAVERMRRVGADRIPRVAEPDGAAQGGSALAAHPDRRVGLLHR